MIILTFIAGLLLGVVFVEAFIIFFLQAKIDDLKIRLENAWASIDYWHDRWEKDNEK